MPLWELVHERMLLFFLNSATHSSAISNQPWEQRNHSCTPTKKSHPRTRTCTNHTNSHCLPHPGWPITSTLQHREKKSQVSPNVFSPSRAIHKWCLFTPHIGVRFYFFLPKMLSLLGVPWLLSIKNAVSVQTLWHYKVAACILLLLQNYNPKQELIC